MEANNKQIGGNHYKSTYQHWDMAMDIDMKYFEGNATKYLARWRKKNGLQDLEKAKHYIQKLLENLHLKTPKPALEADTLRIINFLEVNNILGKDRQAILLIATWSKREDLEHAVELIDELILALVEADSVTQSPKVEEPVMREERDEWRS